jgi:hypothetical protein
LWVEVGDPFFYVGSVASADSQRLQ